MKLLNKSNLIKKLRIKDPFLMIDKIDKINIGKSGIGHKLIKKNEWFFKCHLIDKPMMPGVLQTEAMLQTVVGVVHQHKHLINKNCIIVKSTTNFYSEINKPGKITIKVKIILLKEKFTEAIASIYFGKKKKSEGNFKFFNILRKND